MKAVQWNFVHKKTGVEELHIVVKESLEKIQKIFAQEGATKVKFEHKQVSQIGNGLSIKLKPSYNSIDSNKALGIDADLITNYRIENSNIDIIIVDYILTIIFKYYKN